MQERNKNIDKRIAVNVNASHTKGEEKYENPLKQLIIKKEKKIFFLINI